MSSPNEIWLLANGHRVRLDLDDETQLLPSFQANDRTKPDTIQSDYSPEFSVPGTAHNHRLLGQAAAAQPVAGQAYTRVPCVLTSSGVETLPLGLLYLKGFREGRYLLQLFGGNRRLVEQLGEKTLADLDFNRFNHYWLPGPVAQGLPYAHWARQGWGYEVYERGKPLDFANLSPYDLYPSVSGELIFQQIMADAGFTADSLAKEPFFKALNVPAANPYEFSQAYRDKRYLEAGFFHLPNYDRSKRAGGILHEGQFAAERLNFSYTSQKPYHQPDPTTGASYFAGRYTADTLGYYDLAGSVALRFGCRVPFPGSVRAFVEIRINGKPIFDAATGLQQGKEEAETKDYITKTFNPKLDHYLLHPNDQVELWWRGDEISQGLYGINPTDPYWQIGPWGAQSPLPNSDGLYLANEVRFTVKLLAEFPPGGLVKLQDWLPNIKQLDYVKAYMLLGGLTIQADQYTNHLRLATGAQLLENVPLARDWTAKRDAYALPSRLPERELVYRFGEYGQVNQLRWAEDEHVTKGTGDGVLLVADEVLPATYELATLPFAASESSPNLPTLLRILNFEPQDLTATPPTYSSVEAKPRLTLRRPDGDFLVNIITTPATSTSVAVTHAVLTTSSYFLGVELTLDLDGTVLTEYWADLRAMLDQVRYLTEYYRLTPRDIAELDFSIPIWDGLLGDYFAVSAVGEYDPRRAVEVRLARLNAAHLPAPMVPDDGAEFYSEEFYNSESY
ncbi:MAG: hypothetical protein ACRYG7_13115 [Janthinobacterium lividum]